MFEKGTKFVDKHKGIIVLGGVVVAVVTYNRYVRHMQKVAFNKGVIAGFNRTIKWFDTRHPTLNLEGLWLDWVKENPDKIVTITL